MSKSPTWEELKALVDKQLAEAGLKGSEVTVDYIDIGRVFYESSAITVCVSTDKTLVVV